MKLEFKKGSKYSRKDIGWVCFPDKGRPAGGDWDTGYVRVEDNLIIFMNIGVPGTTEHDFDNHYDHSKGVIVWYGKPRSHSQQPTFQKLLSGEMTPHFFARWDNKDPQFYHKSKLVVGVEFMPYKKVLEPIIGSILLDFGGTIATRGVQDNRTNFKSNENVQSKLR